MLYGIIRIELIRCSFLDRLNQELREIPEWKKYWKKLQKKEKSEKNPDIEWERNFLQVRLTRYT